MRTMNIWAPEPKKRTTQGTLTNLRRGTKTHLKICIYLEKSLKVKNQTYEVYNESLTALTGYEKSVTPDERPILNQLPKYIESDKKLRLHKNPEPRTKGVIIVPQLLNTEQKQQLREEVSDQKKATKVHEILLGKLYIYIYIYRERGSRTRGNGSEYGSFAGEERTVPYGEYG